MAGELDSRPARESATARSVAVRSVLPALLCSFVLVEVNYPTFSPQSQLAIFGSAGLVYCFMTSRSAFLRPWLDRLCILLSALCGGYIVVQTEGWFSPLWLQGTSLGNRAGQEPGLDLFIGLVGLLLVLEAARRSLGWALPALLLRFPCLLLCGAASTGLAAAASRLQPGSCGFARLPAESGCLWNRAPGDVHLCLSFCCLWSASGTDRRHRLHSGSGRAGFLSQ